MNFQKKREKRIRIEKKEKREKLYWRRKRVKKKKKDAWRMWKEIGDRERGILRPKSFTTRIKSNRIRTLQISNHKDIVSPHRASINSLQVPPPPPPPLQLLLYKFKSNFAYSFFIKFSWKFCVFGKDMWLFSVDLS